MTKILSVNAGSSSLKFQLLEMPAQSVITKGLVERIGFEDGVFNIKFEDQKIEKVLPIKDHSIAVQLLLEALLELNIVSSYEEISGSWTPRCSWWRKIRSLSSCNTRSISRNRSIIRISTTS